MRAYLPIRTASALFPALILVGASLGQTTERVSVDSFGNEASNDSFAPVVCANGRYVAFHSWASNLVSGDTNSQKDVFVHDRLTGITERVSVASTGVEGNDWSICPSFSEDGQLVAFSSMATNLVPGDTNGREDVFVHDRRTGKTERVSVSTSGGEGGSWSQAASLSADGRFVAFESRARNLVPGDTNMSFDIFVHDRQTGVTERVSKNSSGTQGNDVSYQPSISKHGRYVSFQSSADNLVAGDTNRKYDVFVHDRQTGLTERVSVDSSGAEGNETSTQSSISADGRMVAFLSAANNLVPGDTNGVLDFFVHDRLTGVTERVNMSSNGMQANDGSGLLTSIPMSMISANGQHVVFESLASNLVPGDTGTSLDVFVHDRQTGVTERVSVNSLGIEGNGESGGATISANGRYVSFQSEAGNLVLGDVGGHQDIFVHDRWSGRGQNSIYLAAPTTAPVGAPIDFNWQSTRGNSHYWLLYSQNMNGGRKDGHKFDIGYPVSILARGVNSTNGLGSHTSLPVPPRAAGYTIYFEVAARDENGVAYDSNVVGVTFQ
jgi:WD40 repeat protein